MVTVRWGRLWFPVILWVVWWLLDRQFTVVAGEHGLLAPFGPVRVGPLVLGLGVIWLRLLGTFVWLPWAAVRVLAVTERKDLELLAREPK